MKKLIYTDHIKLQMAKRGIAKKHIIITLTESHITLPTVDPQRSRVMRRFGSKTLDVIYAEKSNRIILITAVWLTKKERRTQ